MLMPNILVTIFLATLIKLISSCTTLYYNPFPNERIEADLAPYVQSFVEDAEKHGMTIDVSALQAKIVDMPEEIGPMGWVTVGTCYYQAAAWKESPLIIISRSYWKDASPSNRKVLMYHELGHCMLLRDHDDTMTEVGKKEIHSSIMNSFVLAPFEFRDSEKYYVDELFANVSEEIRFKYVRLHTLPGLELKP